jgi:type I restriction enzyme R subunit
LLSLRIENDLDDQLYGQFSKVKDFLRQTPQQATSRENLKELLDGRLANGIFFTLCRNSPNPRSL